MLHNDAGPGALRVARVTVYGLWFVLIVTTPVHQLVHFPDFMFVPPGILMLFPEAFWAWFLQPAVLWFMRVSLAGLLLVVVVQQRPGRWLLLLAAAAVLFYHGFILGFGGFLNHSRFALLYLAVILSLAPDTPAESAPKAVLRLCAMIMATAYALIGLHRLFIGGYAIFVNDALPTYMMLRTFEPGNFTFDLTYRLVGSSWILILVKSGFFVTTIAEVLTPAAVFHRRIRIGWLAVVVPFHLATLLTMNIFFWENLILIGLLFTEAPTRIANQFNRSGPRAGVELPAARPRSVVEALPGAAAAGESI